MHEKRGPRRRRQRLLQSAHMVGVPVAEHDGIGLREIDAEPARIVEQRHALPGVEQHAMRPGIEPPRQAVLAEHAHAARRVLHQKRQ